MATNEERLREIIRLANVLGWIGKRQVIIYNSGKSDGSYPPMQLSEVEKCMLAMVDDMELERMRKWVKEKKGDD
jgi:hypothetical protein